MERLSESLIWEAQGGFRPGRGSRTRFSPSVTSQELKVEKECTPVVEVLEDNTVTITNVKVSTSGAGDSRERVRSYHADYTFDSACHADNARYASQDKVFNTLGQDVLACLLKGSSACVLAYGQSSTGKTHTMMGNDGNPGLIPRLCSALASSEPQQITMSFLEIYNERVHDLLVGEEPVSEYHSLPRRRGNTRKDLRVREHPERGPYVQNLRRVVVHDEASLLALVYEGARRRRTAATRRNATSSRSHALLELSTPRVTLHLADLAGSEKASWEGCGGGRQKEGANINKSLVALSNVISALVNSGIGRSRFVPYRDSALTWLLKDCFTGGGAAFIIATVSPSVACYGESASTLRWASRARQLRVPPRLRLSSTHATRAILQTQLQQIIAELTRNHISFVFETGKLQYDDKHWMLHNLKFEQNKELENGRGKITEEMNPSKNINRDTPHSGSTASSVASGSSDCVSSVDKQKYEISKGVDKVFGPALERTHSGSDLKVIAPLRHKRRQYRSQEVLPHDNQVLNERKISLHNIPLNNTNEHNKDQHEELEKKSKFHVPILYDNNQRAEIVASVTERLYTKLKKKEEAAKSKVESMVDKKIMEPLSELKICTNARQRLVELSQKALRNRRRIGIPAYTQTKFRVTRVKDQSIDVQTDLEPYVKKDNDVIAFYQNVGTETNIITPRCREAAVGPSSGSMRYQDQSTFIEQNKIIKRSCSVMTENCVQIDRFTQTPIVPPPRRRKIYCHSKYLNEADAISDDRLSPVISINIVQTISKEPDSTSDDSLENTEIVPTMSTKNIAMPPDLLTNHSPIDTNKNTLVVNNLNQTRDGSGTYVKDREILNTASKLNDEDSKKDKQCNKSITSEDIFSDNEEYNLPRVSVPDKFNSGIHKDITNMILGRNENVHPYNIILSPPRVKVENNKRTVKFKDLEDTPSLVSVASQTWEVSSTTSASMVESNDIQSDNESSKTDSNDSTCSEPADVSKCTNFVWKKGYNTNQVKNNTASSGSFYLNQNLYNPVYRNARSNTAKTKFYKEFLGLETNNCPRSCSILTQERNSKLRANFKETIYESEEENGIADFRQKMEFFESKGPSIFNQTRDPFYDFESKLLKSCDRLDASIDKYDDYLKKYRQRSQNILSPEKLYSSKKDFVHVKPKEYLQHLVQIRKNVVQGDMSSSTSSGSIF